jgi:hypothetical protein
MPPDSGEMYPVIGTVEGSPLYFYFGYDIENLPFGEYQFLVHAELVDDANLSDILSYGNENEDAYVEIVDDPELPDDLEDIIPATVTSGENY